MKIIPLIVCVYIFIFTTIGFFRVSEKIEKVYVMCIVLSAVCTVFQLAIIF